MTQTTPIPAILRFRERFDPEDPIRDIVLTVDKIEFEQFLIHEIEASRKEVLEEELIWIRKQSLKSARAGVLGYDFVSRLEKRLKQKVYGKLQALGTEEPKHDR